MYGRFDYYGAPDIDREMRLEEARGTQIISIAQMMDLKKNPKAKQMAIRGAPGGAFAGYEVKTFPSREAMIAALKKATRHPSHGALGRKEWRALIKDKVAKNMVAYPSYQEEQLELAEGRKGVPRPGTRVKFQPNPASFMLYSADHRRRLPDKGGEGTVTTIAGPRGKMHYMSGPGGGLVYVKWDDTGTVGVSPLDIVKVKGGGSKKAAAGGGGKGEKFSISYGGGPPIHRFRVEARERKWLRIKASMFKGKKAKKQEGIQAEIDRLDATSSPFPEIREKRIAELRTELNDASDANHTELTERKQKLVIGSVRKKLPPLYSQEKEKDPMVYLKLFSPYMAMGYWLITEFDGDDTMFGAANTGHGWELGYSSLKEMEGAKYKGVQAIERDMYFKPKKLSAAKAEIARSRGES